MGYKNLAIMASFVFLLSGCSTAQMIKNSFQGTQYLQAKNYTEGESTFRKAVTQNPNDPLAHYYLGRFLLAQEKSKEALPYLQRAVSLKPKDKDYLFWQGVAYGELGRREQERKSYQQVLQIDGKHVQALTYLGHSQFRAKEYEVSLATYQKVLNISPNNPSALYNRALIAKILGQSSEEKAGWMAYLNNYPSGDLAIQAINHLNLLGDFSYQNHYLGVRTIPLPKIGFEPFSDELTQNSKQALDVVGATATNIGRGKLQVIVFQENNKELAKSRAISIKKYLNTVFPELTRDGVGVSWFEQPETLVLQGKKLKNPDSVRFFLTGMEINILSNKNKKKLTSMYLPTSHLETEIKNVTFSHAVRIEG